MRAKFAGGYAAAFCAVAVGWVIFAWPWLSGEFTIPYDAKAHFQAQLQFLARALHTGQSPFWTHNVFGGSPQIADPQSLIFSPAFLIAYFDPAPSFRVLDTYCFLLLGMAAVSVLMLFKDRGWHPAGATLAALATAFGGSAIWRIQHVKQIESFAFFVLSFWLLTRAVERKSVLYGVLTGTAIGCMVIEPGQVAMLGCYVMTAYVLTHWFASPRFWPAVKSSIYVLTPGAIVASVFASVPIVLAYLFVKSSNRPDIPFEEAGRGALHPASLLTAIVSDLYGAHSQNVPYWGPASSDWRADWLAIAENMGQIYVGALPILIILTAGILRRTLWTREIRFFSFAACGFLLYGLGRYTPAFRFLYDYFPGVDLFRRPADATYALGVMLAILGGYLVHRRLEGTLPKGNNRQWVIEAICVIALFVTCLGVAVAHDHLDVAALPMITALVFTAGAFGVWFFAGKMARQQSALAVAIVAAFMIADLSYNNGPARSTALPPANYDMLRVDTANATVGFLKAHLRQPLPSARRDRIELAGLGFEWPNLSLIHDFDHVLGYNPLRLGYIIDAMGANETVAEPNQRYFTPLFPSYHSTLADLLGLRYIALKKPAEELDKRLRAGDLTLVANTKDAYIYENPHALPRVIFARDWRRANFDAMVKDGLWPDFDPKNTVLLENKPADIKPSRLHAGLPRDQKIALTTYDNTLVEIEVEAPQPGFVVLNDIWQNWWFASVDGEPAEILRANVLFRAVQVPAGRHVVRFEFMPLKGAAHEIMAALENRFGKKKKPPVPEVHPRPEAIAPEVSNRYGKVRETLR